MSNLSNVQSCSPTRVILFVLALIFGTGCSICSKTMMSLPVSTVDENGLEVFETFQKPLFQTFGMFVGMTFGLLMHIAVVMFKIPFPGYAHGSPSNGDTDEEKATELTPLKNGEPSGNDDDATSTAVPVWMYFFLAVPAVFDLAATALCMMGLQYLDVSIYQMLRGSAIIFVALMKQHVLKERLHSFHWVGVGWNVVSVVLVGATALLAAASLGGTDDESNADGTSSKALLGVCLLLAGAFVQGLQYVFEERLMKLDVPAPPLLLIGMEGIWGTILGLTVMYPLGYYLPGDDHGSYEDPFHTWDILKENKNIQMSFVIYFFTIFFYNLFAVLVTFELSSVWHAILDNFRPITIWISSLAIYYFIDPTYGEAWTTFSYIQLVGMAILLYGTAIYNAPNSGSIELRGDWYACGIDMSDEYEAIKREMEEEDANSAWEAKQLTFKKKRLSSFMESPRDRKSVV